MTKKLDYKQLRQELDTIVSELQLADISVDTALEKHQRATEIIDTLEDYLKNAENTLKKAVKPNKD
jgi:exodeoxyribonuclease VII small subunit